VDLDDLQRRPCGPEDIVWLPTLLPQAALLLHAQGVRVVVTTHGGASSHGARMAWELGLTALVGIGPRLDLEDGDLVCLDPGTGQLSVARARSHDPSAS
jgi:phosphoenolpyruvate-protein kinase (PTS system EI component)